MIVIGRMKDCAGRGRHRSVTVIGGCSADTIFDPPVAATLADRSNRENVTGPMFLMLRRKGKRRTFPAARKGLFDIKAWRYRGLAIFGALRPGRRNELGMTMLKGKSALVTGSTSGIGLAIARALAAQGANITINGFGDKDAIEQERSRIEKDFGVKALYSPADMSKAGDIADMVHTSEKTFGSLDVLVNNAGIQYVAPIEEFPIEKWEQIIAINLSAAFYAIRAAVPGMKSRKWGRIISTASAHSLVASPFKSAYVSAKHGIAGLTKTVALEVATFGITSNCISPGYVWTPLVEKQIPDTMKARGMTADQVKRDVLLAAQPTKEFVTVEEVADLAVYLCSDAARSITGANLSIDGGWTAE
jgi:3-hydroxybutyrate dehydrogenase